MRITGHTQCFHYFNYLYDSSLTPFKPDRPTTEAPRPSNRAQLYVAADASYCIVEQCLDWPTLVSPKASTHLKMGSKTTPSSFSASAESSASLS